MWMGQSVSYHFSRQWAQFSQGRSSSPKVELVAPLKQSALKTILFSVLFCISTFHVNSSAVSCATVVMQPSKYRHRNNQVSSIDTTFPREDMIVTIDEMDVKQ